jgi:hypothetical protein
MPLGLLGLNRGGPPEFIEGHPLQPRDLGALIFDHPLQLGDVAHQADDQRLQLGWRQVVEISGRRHAATKPEIALRGKPRP